MVKVMVEFATLLEDQKAAWAGFRTPVQLFVGTILVCKLLIVCTALLEPLLGPAFQAQKSLLDERQNVPLNWLNWPKKDEEVLLMNYGQFAQTYPRSEIQSELAFISELLAIGRHNLATLSGEQTYFRRQAPISFRFGTDAKFANATLKLLPADSEGRVSHPAAELKRVNLVGRLINRFAKSERDFEIPNLPLNEQPEPDRITHIDADLRGCTGAIKDQKSCGACYAFSWLSLAEWHYCSQKNDGQVADFSEQHLVDCGHVAHLNGCLEGKLSDAKDFSQVFGVHLEARYPYTSKRGACKRAQGELELRVENFRRIRVDRGQFEQTLYEQPILLEVHLPDDIRSYSSGIHPGSNCNSQLGHGMLLVGHGRQEGRPYWLLRNSMGKRWGENGYLRLARDMPDMKRCFKSAFVARFRFKDLEEQNYTHLYHRIKFQPANDSPSKLQGTDLLTSLASV